MISGGLRTVVYRSGDLGVSKAFYSRIFGVQPYFDEPFYVGFNLSGYELGLDPDHSTPPGPGGTVAYWGVSDLDGAVAEVLAAGATVVEPPHEVGGGIKVAVFADPSGNLVGLIDNPHFKLP